MAKKTKKRSQMMKELAQNKIYPLQEAVDMVKKLAQARFDESIDIALRLGVDPKRSEQNVRGVVILPKGSGKNVQVAVFCSPAQENEAKSAGADLVGGKELVEKLLAGADITFNQCLATPDMMPLVGKLGRILGTKGMMPNPKLGTVTENVAKVVHDMKTGQVTFKTEKNAIVHASVGRVGFQTEDIMENIKAFIAAVIKAKPDSAKGQYLKTASLSSTMGLGVPLALQSVTAS